jgi:glycosyltransferase involved in cell wall biosynthesis
LTSDNDDVVDCSIISLNLQMRESLPDVPKLANSQRRRLICFVNGIFGEGIGGGDVYFSYIARAAMEAGYLLHFFGGHALKPYLERQGFPLNLTLTDSGIGRLGNVATLSGQFRLLWDFGRRLRGSLKRLSEIQPDDIAYAMSDYWFDSIPLMRCRARTKILYVGMLAPTLAEVVFRKRADVMAVRLPSLYFWMSQQFSLRAFRRCPDGIVTYCHQEMRDYILRFGYRESQLCYVPNGSDVATADRIPEQTKKFDLAWVGRVHPQKGIDDLIATLVWLKKQMPDFRAVIIGKSQSALEPVIRNIGLADNVEFSGLVSEEEKFRLLKSSRVFAMPSRYESFGIVVAEALACGVPVVAYRLSCYPGAFGDFIRYVPSFDVEQFKRNVEEEVRNQRAGRNYLASMDWVGLKRELSWTTAQNNFRGLLARVENQPA